jgi:ribosomal protein L23
VDELLQGVDDAEIRITIPQSLTIIAMGYQTGNVDDNEVKKDIREVVELAYTVRGYDVKDENVKKEIDDYVEKIFDNLRVATLRGRLQNKYLKMR